MKRTVKEIRRELKEARKFLTEMEARFELDIERYAHCGVRPEAVQRQRDAGQAAIQRYETEVVDELENDLADAKVRTGEL